MTYTFDETIVSDLHKDAYGYRPRDMFWSTWEDADMDGKQAIWDRLIVALEAEIAFDRKCKEEAYSDILNRIAETMALGAGDMTTAIKWIIDAEGFSKHDLWYGADHFCYHFGLDYSAKDTLPIKAAIDEILKIAA